MKNIKNKIKKGLAIAGICLSTIAEGQNLLHSPFAITSLNNKYLGGYGFSITKTPVVQSDVGFGLGKINYDFWSNYDLDRKDLTEINNTISTSFELGKYNLSTSALHYNSPSKDFKDALEFGARISRKDLPIELSLFVANKLENKVKPGQIINLRANKTLELTKRLSTNIQADLTYNKEYWAVGNGFSHASLNGALNLELGKGFSASAYIKGQKAIQSLGENFKDNSAYGISLTR